MEAAATGTRPFVDRREVGRELAKHERLAHYRDRDDAVVLAVPRGGVPAAYELAEALDLPLDVLVVRKLGVPGHEELAMGAIASGGARVLDDELVRSLELDEATVAAVAAEEQRQLEERERRYRRDRGELRLKEMAVILVDDGLATGSTMRVAVQAIRAHEPAEVVVAVPVSPPQTCDALREEADEVICAVTPELFHTVGAWYERFEQTGDMEVIELLGRRSGRRG